MAAGALVAHWISIGDPECRCLISNRFEQTTLLTDFFMKQFLTTNILDQFVSFTNNAQMFKYLFVKFDQKEAMSRGLWPRI